MPKLQSLRNVWPTVASVLLVSAAFPPLNFMLLVFAALVPWLMRLRNLTGKQAYRDGLLFGFLFGLAQMNWLLPFVARWTHNWLLAAIPWLLVGLGMMMFFGLVAWLMNQCYRTDRLWLIPLVWACVEIFRSYIPELAFPWGLIAVPLWKTPMIVQHAAIGNIYFVSAWIVLVNVMIAEFLQPKEKINVHITRRAFRMALVSLSLLMFSIYRYGNTPAVRNEVVTIGQLGVDMAFGDPALEEKQLRFACDQLMAAAVLQGSKVLLLPEGLVRGGNGMPPPTPFSGTPLVPVLFGGQRHADGVIYQSAYAYDGKWQFGDKTRLVIFGEYVPFRKQFPSISEAFSLPAGDMKEGSVIKTLDVAGLRMGPMICFEGLFANIAEAHARNGAQVIAIMAIDDWYLGTTAQDQLFSGSVWRAIENGLPVMRAGALGPSAAIDARGNVIVTAPLRQLMPMRVELPVPDKSDAYPYRWLFGYLSLAASLWVIGEAIVLKRRAASGKQKA